MIRAITLLLLLLLAACSDEKLPKQAVNEMIESPLQNTVISSFDHYPPRPVVRDSEPDITAALSVRRHE
jgi:PBP1b-binding outer membrane lipoprotein LpoB